MAQLFPGLETIDHLKPPPTAGEKALLEYLSKHLTDKYEVYFQPYFNGLRPDVVVIKKGWGVMIIEVKDWDLSSYFVNAENKWKLLHTNTSVMSPYQQVFTYKKSMFDLHIEGLAEAKISNPNFFNILKPFVYFHGANKADIDNIFEAASTAIKHDRDRLNEDRSNGRIPFETYDKKMDYLELKRRHLNRDRGMTLHQGALDRVQTALRAHTLFTEEIYEKFKRYLQPPVHTRDQGKIINYGVMQKRLTESGPGFAKIKGVAGSGKTTVLAKRAVNAHIRHKQKVLILTFNLTLRNYIHDRISEVRDEFSWGAFGIINYHSFVMDQYRKVGGAPDKYRSIDELFSDEHLFDDFDGMLEKYQTILIDEIQDFDRSWIHIIRKYFLEDDGEMVLFGDECQNIYERPVNKREAEIVRGFGRWERLRVSYRSPSDSPLTALIFDYQKHFLVNKYDIDTIEGHVSDSAQLTLDVREKNALELAILDQFEDWTALADDIYTFMKTNKIHPNDLCIVGGEIAALRQLEKAYKERTGEDTNSTFETLEQYEEVLERFDPEPMPPDVKEVLIEEELTPVRRSKKYHFWQNRGTVKLSTVHSYKGLEARSIVYILSRGDSAEIAYTAITRSTRNLLILVPRGHRNTRFFEERLSKFTPV